MKFLLCTAGSLGDVLPFVALGRELARRGHAPHLFANAMYAPHAERAGVPFTPTGDAERQAGLMADPDATDPRKGLALLARGVMRTLPTAVERLRQAVEPGGTVIVGSSMAWGARVAGELARVPTATLHLSPSWFRSEYRAPSLGPLGHLARAPRALKRALYRVMDRRLLDPHFTQPFNAFRADLGLAPVRRVFHHWMHEADLTLAAFPAWFAAPQPDWPAGLTLSGFPMTEPARAPLPAALEAFLAAGAAPVGFTAGTANASSGAFFEASADACRRSGRRGLLVTQDARQLPAEMPQGVMHVPYADFDALLPRLSAFVHHGGVGTTARALRAGVPQLIRPMGFDQFDNARRAMALGVARQLPPRRYRADAVVRALDALLGDPRTTPRCGEVAARIAGEGSGIDAACDRLESWAVGTDAQRATRPAVAGRIVA